MTQPRRKKLTLATCTRQQMQFVEGLVAGMTGLEAARNAGYNSPRAHYALLQKSHVQLAIANRTVQVAKESGSINLDWLLDKAVRGVIRPLRKSQMQALRMAAILLRRKEAQAEPPPDPPLPVFQIKFEDANHIDDELHGRPG